MKCVYCCGEDVYVVQVRRNKSGDKEIYRCRGCKRRFVERDEYVKFRHGKQVIGFGLVLRRRGYSLAEVCCGLKRNFGVEVSRKTVMDWEKRLNREKSGEGF